MPGCIISLARAVELLKTRFPVWKCCYFLPHNHPAAELRTNLIGITTLRLRTTPLEFLLHKNRTNKEKNPKVAKVSSTLRLGIGQQLLYMFCRTCTKLLCTLFTLLGISPVQCPPIVCLIFLITADTSPPPLQQTEYIYPPEELLLSALDLVFFVTRPPTALKSRPASLNGFHQHFWN